MQVMAPTPYWPTCALATKQRTHNPSIQLTNIHLLDTREQLLEVRLDDGRVAGLAQNLQQVVITQEVEARELRALLLQEVRQRALAHVQLLSHLRQLVADARDISKGDHLLGGLQAGHGPAELLVHVAEALLLRWQRTTAEDGLQVDPLALDLVEQREALLQE